MKKLLAVFALCAATSMAADFTGYIIDKSCAAKKGMQGDEECAKRCIGRGDPAMLVTEEGQVYAISNQDKVKEFAGKKVVLTGKLQGDSITVDKVAVPKT